MTDALSPAAGERAIRVVPGGAARALAATVAVSAWTGVLLQLYVFLERTLIRGAPIGPALAAFFGYFTILTNIFVGIAVGTAALASDRNPGRRAGSTQLTGLLASAMILVALGYHFLLRGVWDPQGLDKIADVLLHSITPALLLLYWWLAASSDRLSWRTPLLWSLYPVAYFVYVLLRGLIIGSYPYPFIDVTAIGYGQSLLSALGLLIAFWVTGSVLVAISRWRSA